MFGGGDAGWVALWPGDPNPVQTVGRNGKHKERIAPTTGRPMALANASETPVGNGMLRGMPLGF